MRVLEIVLRNPLRMMKLVFVTILRTMFERCLKDMTNFMLERFEKLL
jgi:hypothetical protein